MVPALTSSHAHQAQHLHAQPDKLRLCLHLRSAVVIPVAAAGNLVHVLFSIPDVIQSAHLLLELGCLIRQILHQCMLRRI